MRTTRASSGSRSASHPTGPWCWTSGSRWRGSGWPPTTPAGWPTRSSIGPRRPSGDDPAGAPMTALQLTVRLIHAVGATERALLPPDLQASPTPDDAAWVAARAVLEAVRALPAGPVFLLVGREDLTDVASIVPQEVET